MYAGPDYYELDEWLTEEEIMIRDAVREWVAERVLPIIEEHYRSGHFEMELVPEMAELGLFGMTLPEKYGSAGLKDVAYGLVMQELEWGDSGIRSFASVQSALVIYPIFNWGSQEQIDYWLPKLIKAEKIGAFGLTEPDYGSNPAGMITKAQKVDGGYILNGTKTWITNSSIAEVMVVWAKLEGMVAGFLLEKGWKGLSCPEIRGKWSLRASVTGEIVMDDVFVPESHRLPNANGIKCPLSCLTKARYGIAWGVLGAAMACYSTALDYSQTRIQWGKPIAGFQMVQEKLVKMLTEITKAQLLVYRLGRMQEAGKAQYWHVSLAKRNNCEMARYVAKTARDLLGANGISEEYPIMRHLMNLEAVYTYEGTHHMQTLIVGGNITGMEAYQ
jgi:glutaryl-CoA dehydrogenase